MEEQILKLITNHIEYRTVGKVTVPVMTGDDADKLAKALADMNREFVEWFHVSWGGRTRYMGE